MHPADLQATVTNTKDFETVELEANHVQAINLVMNRSSELDSKLKQFIFSSKLLIKCKNISTKLHTYNAATNLSTANISANSTCHLSSAAPTHLSAVVSGNLLAPTNSNTAPKLTSKQNSKAETDTAKLKIINSSPLTNSQFHSTIIRILTIEFKHWIHPKPKFPELFKFSATIFENKSLDAIFPFELDKLSTTPLFSEAALKEKPITAMYTDAKVDGHSIKLILDSRSAGSIITKQFIDQLGC
ncbi:hypothetical protein G9A89_012467 [Geosiphon pyriformis]|nr:hypothetical protein G9A89_012467 [Geosiphon pyriformis]